MKFFVTVILVVVVYTCPAQVELPTLSPEEKINQTIGYTHFEIRYGRPAARGRKIMGDLVKYDQLWRTGAGPCTTMQFDQPVAINHQPVAAGVYALLTIPSAGEWTVLLNSDTTKLYGAPSEYDVRREVVRFKVKPQRTGRFYESLTLDIDVVNNNGLVYLSWENTQISFLIETNSYAVAKENIRKALEKNPTNPELLASVAYYYEMNNQDLKEALKFVKTAMTLKEDWWYYQCAIDLQTKLNDRPAAIQTAKDAIVYLRKVKPDEYASLISGFEEEIRKLKE